VKLKLPHPAFLSALAVAPPLALATDGGVAGSDIAFLAYLAGGVVGVVSVVAWVDHRVDKRVKAHEVVEEAQAESRHQSLLTEIRHLQGRLVDAGVLPAATSSGTWKLTKQHHSRDDE
jgi:hypothetical protein